MRCPWQVALVPIAALATAALVEIGSLVAHAAAVNRGLDAAVSYAAGSQHPLSDAARQSIRNIVMTGSPRSDARLLVPGWKKAGADVHIEEFTHRVAGSSISAVRIVLTVPYDPVLRGLIPFPRFHLHLSRDRAVVTE